MRLDGAASRFGAFRTATLPARDAEKTLAPPAPRYRLQRSSHHLRHEKHFNHVVVPDGTCAARPGGQGPGGCSHAVLNMKVQSK
jgi:hypothetical protein